MWYIAKLRGESIVRQKAKMNSKQAHMKDWSRQLKIVMEELKERLAIGQIDNSIKVILDTLIHTN